MKGSNIWVTDRFGFDVIPINDGKKHEFIEVKDDISTLVGARSLLTKLAASHWGYINKNGFYYDPSTVDGSIPTWTTPYPKPVLTYHPRDEDKEITPIGRIVGAKYIEGVAKPFIDDDLLPNNVPDGHLEFLTRISDPEAIPKVIDRRYDTVSISAMASNVTCSICGEPVANKGGKCKHRRFVRYAKDGSRDPKDGEVCYYKAGPLLGRHVAFVITPSDVYAGVKGVEWEGAISDNSVATSDVLMELFVYSEEDSLLMSLNDEESTNLFDKLDTGRKTVIFDMLAINDGKEGVEVKLTIEDIMIMTEADIDSKLTEDAECMTEDAKLSTAARKKLPDSAFCGPGRSFPAHDAAHVRAGLRLLNTSDASGSTKATILSCLRSRAKKYGIKVGAKVRSDSESEWAIDELIMTDTLLCDATLEDILSLDIVNDYIIKLSPEDIKHIANSDSEDDSTDDADTTTADPATDTDTTTVDPATEKALADKDAEIAAIDADKSEIYREYKTMIVDRILSIKINSGEIVADDRDEQAKVLMVRSLESLKDTLVDISGTSKVLTKVDSRQVDGDRDPDAITNMTGRTEMANNRRAGWFAKNIPTLKQE